MQIQSIDGRSNIIALYFIIIPVGIRINFCYRQNGPIYIIGYMRGICTDYPGWVCMFVSIEPTINELLLIDEQINRRSTVCHISDMMGPIWLDPTMCGVPLAKQRQEILYWCCYAWCPCARCSCDVIMWKKSHRIETLRLNEIWHSAIETHTKRQALTMAWIVWRLLLVQSAS